MRRVFLAGLLCAACGTATQPSSPGAPLVIGASDGGAPAQTAVGFLPPLASGGAAISPLAEDLSPSVVISEVVLATGTVLREVKRFGPGAAPVKHIPGCCYEALWDTAGLVLSQPRRGLTTANGFLIDVQVNGASGGAMTLVLVSSEADLATVDTSKYAGAVLGKVVDVRAAIGLCAGVACPAKACQANACNPATGACVSQGLPDGRVCSDGNACTSGDVCASGACVGQPVDCNDGTACTVDSCDPVKGCVHTPVADGTACTYNGCGGSASCQRGVCEQHDTPQYCSDGNGCTADACVGRSCTHTAIIPCSQRLAASWSWSPGTSPRAPEDVSVTGSDFQPDEQVTVRAEAKSTTVSADSAGRFSSSIFSLVGKLSAGPHEVSATGRTGLVNTTYTVGHRTDGPYVGFAGDHVSIAHDFLSPDQFSFQVFDLEPGETVTVSFSPAPLTDPGGSGLVSPSGNFESPPIPASAFASNSYVAELKSSLSGWRGYAHFNVYAPSFSPIPDQQVGLLFKVDLNDAVASQVLDFEARDPSGVVQARSQAKASIANQARVTLQLPDSADTGIWRAVWRDHAFPARTGSAAFKVVRREGPVAWSLSQAGPLRVGSVFEVDAVYLGDHETVSFSIGGVQQGSAQSNGGGGLAASLAVATSTPLGAGTLVAAGSAGASTSFAVEVLPSDAWSIAAAPTKVTRGQAFTVTGVGGRPDRTARVSLLNPSGAVEAAATGLAIDAAGHFSTTLTVRTSAAPGAYTLSARSENAGVPEGPSATAPLEVGALLELTPALVASGGTFQLLGRGFAAREAVVFHLDGALLGSGSVADDAGAVSATSTFQDPGGGPRHTVDAVGQTSGLVASATLTAAQYCNLATVSSLSGSGAAGQSNGTGGPPDLGSTWQSPWGLTVVPFSRPMRLWVTDPGNHALRQIFAEGNAGAATSVLATRDVDGEKDPSFGDVRGVHLIIYLGINAFMSDAAKRCIRYNQGSDQAWVTYVDFTNNCDGTGSANAVRPVDTYAAVWAGDADRPDALYVGSLDDGLGCITEVRDDVGYLYTRGCRPAGSTVKLEAIAADPASSVLYTNSWLASGSSTPDGVMKVVGRDGDIRDPLQLTLFAQGTAAAPLHASGLTVGGDGYLYLADGQANALYRISPDGSEVLLLAGGTSGPFADGTGCAATFSQPHGLAWAQTADGPALFVADTGNRRVRKVLLPH